MTKYLKDRSYYENIYDNRMIEDCVSFKSNLIKNGSKDPILNNINLENAAEGLIMLRKYDWYKNRESHIEKEMNRDKEKDKLIQNTLPFPERYCRNCNSLLSYEFKEFMDGYGKNKDRLLFVYKCDDCGKRQAIYNDGEERIIKQKVCNKCNDLIEHKAEFKGDLLIEKYNCSNCGNNYEEKTDYSISKDKKNKITKKDKEKYGYNEKEKWDYIESFDRLDETHELMMSYKKKDQKKDLYKETEKLTKLNIVGLQKLLNRGIENTKFSEFKINTHKQEKKGLKIEFNLYYDGEIGDNPKTELIELLDTLLSTTNWDFQRSSFNEKLGIISANLIGFDNIDDLVELIEKRSKKSEK